tara:strand:+ start:274 stop:597 length:324 start_codon:yes stop_codon:yes gene_type:complete
MRVKIKPLSVNEAYRGRRFKTNKYNNWSKEIVHLLPKLDIPNGILLRVDITFGFSSKGSDIDNGLKSFLDALQKKYNFNDSRIYELNVKKDITKKGHEFIDFTIAEL